MSEGRTPIILILSDYYLPGSKSGGTARSVANIVTTLGERYIFKIVTRDHDLGEQEPYPGIIRDTWTQTDKAEILYLSPQRETLLSIYEILNNIRCDLIYLNSFFSWPYTIIPLILRKLRLVPAWPGIIAPRGELSPGAMGLKSRKKALFMALARLVGLYDSVAWQASSDQEKGDIRQNLGGAAPIHVVPDLPRPNSPTFFVPIPAKIPGSLKIIFLSRIARVKNLHYALSLLQDIAGRVEFTICGPLEDKKYWEECVGQIKALPPNITVHYQGAIDSQLIYQEFAKHQVLLLPTLGENFGHVILESMQAGLPALISDKTPWQNLEDDQAGWGIPLDQPEKFRAILQFLTDMDQAEYQTYSQAALRLGARIASDTAQLCRYKQMFAASLGGVDDR